MLYTARWLRPKRLILGLFALAIFLPNAVYGSPPRGSDRFPIAVAGPLFSLQPVLSDFDGDNHLDQAHLSSQGSHKQIHLHLQKSSTKTLSFDSGLSDPGSLLSDDIDRDGDADLIWVSQTGSPMIVFWIGDGHGNFTFISDPVKQAMLRNEFLYGNASWNSIRSSTEVGPDGVLPRDDSSVVAIGAVYVPIFISSQNTRLPHKASVVSALFLSVLQKRGPPAATHQ